MKNAFNTIMSILILIVLAAGVYFIVKTVRDTATAAASAASEPFQQMNQANQSLQTQVSDLLHPTPTIIPDPVTYINQIQALARLETVQYSVQQVVEEEQNQDGIATFLVGNKMLVQISGKVIAGIDLKKMQPDNMRLDNDVLYVTLPPAEILVASLEEDKTKAFNVQTGLFVKPDPNLVISALQAGKQQIVQAALDDGILTQAQSNAESYMLLFFNSLGYKSVIFMH